MPPFTAREPGLSPADGYEAARALHAHRVAAGWKPIGRKIGFTNRTIWPRYGVYEPIWGTVYDRTLVGSEGDSASVSLAGLVQPRIEPEICFGLKRAPASSSPADLLDAIDWIAHSVEIVQCHYPDWKVKLADCCASNGLHGKLVVGSRFPLAPLPDLEASLPRLELVLKKEGREVDRGVGSNVLDSPLLAFGYFVDVLRRQPGARALEAGEIVTTGTITDAHPVAAGETWRTEIRGLSLPGLQIRFE